jgi:hypothetical protein
MSYLQIVSEARRSGLPASFITSTIAALSGLDIEKASGANGYRAARLVGITDSALRAALRAATPSRLRADRDEEDSSDDDDDDDEDDVGDDPDDDEDEEVEAAPPKKPKKTKPAAKRKKPSTPTPKPVAKRKGKTGKTKSVLEGATPKSREVFEAVTGITSRKDAIVKHTQAEFAADDANEARHGARAPVVTLRSIAADVEEAEREGDGTTARSMLRKARAERDAAKAKALGAVAGTPHTGAPLFIGGGR